jgi:hypothetical protein
VLCEAKRRCLAERQSWPADLVGAGSNNTNRFAVIAGSVIDLDRG